MRACEVASVVANSEVQWTVAAKLLCPWDSPGKNTGMGCHALLRGIFPTQGSNLCLQHLPALQAGSLALTPPGKPINSITSDKGINYQSQTSLHMSGTTNVCQDNNHHVKIATHLY